ncbi:glutathione S-transferase N-terminal domain-containing protein [Pseudomonas gozinkensis]|uniref:glutathione S-transferase n=1 Tax=Pseudomonas gozinkensis TaxID=2774461 RepID=UPI001787ECDF|nr:glutathione S-transferase N-terminal domain-containing protein [Pseudomonas gozinkensis]
MKIYYALPSPFVRKVIVTAHLLGLNDSIERLSGKAHPINRDQDIVHANPLGKIPTFFKEDGEPLFDSRVICEYLDSLGQKKVFPSGDLRWQALREQALADGLLDAAMIIRYEKAFRPEALHWAPWLDGQKEKIISALDHFSSHADQLHERIDIGTISIGCALGYLDLRFPDYQWREGREPLAAWFSKFDELPCMKQTRPE